MAEKSIAYPEGDQLNQQISRRHFFGRIWRGLFFASMVLALVVLLALLYNIVNQAFGLVAVEKTIQDEVLIAEYGDGTVQALNALPKETLVVMLQDHISHGLGRRLERDQRFFEDRLVFESEELWAEVCAGAEPSTGCTLPERPQGDVYRLVLERVVEPQVIETWSLVDSLTRRN